MNPHILSMSPADVVMPVYEGLRAQLEDHTLEFLEPRTQEHLRERLRTADFVLGDWTHVLRLDPAELEAAVPCRLVVQPTAGYDSIDVATAAQHGLPVANCPGANARAVAEWAVMAILVALKNAIPNHERTRRGEWWMTKALEEGVYDIGGRTVGILGFGTIGQGVARRLHGFGVQILYQDAYQTIDELEGGMAAEIGPEKVGAGNLAVIAYWGGANGGGGTVEDPQEAADRELPLRAEGQREATKVDRSAELRGQVRDIPHRGGE